jgi:endo-1,4-beta-xylanase
MRTYRLPATAGAIALLGSILLTACGGSPADPVNPSPPPPPAPTVASLAIAGDAPVLVPGQTRALAVVARDAAGNVMTGVTPTWSTSDAARVTVSGSGTVMAAAPGTATITAAVGALTASVGVTVNDGGMALTTGSTITALGGDVVIVIPAGAVTEATALTVRRAPAAPVGGRPLPGTAVTVEPSITFAQPVTVALRYTTPLGPSVVETQLRLARSAGSWIEATPMPVDRTNRRVSGVLPGTGTWAVFEPPPSLRGYAQARGIEIGAAVIGNTLRQDPAYAALVAREMNSVTPEFEMKYFPLRPNPTTWQWANVDTLVEFARRNGQQVHGHTLLWHNSQSFYLTEGTPTREFLMAELKAFVDGVVGRYAGKIASYDVANEVLHPNGGIRQTFWVRIGGVDLIDSVFVWARRRDPATKLYLNDFNVEVINNKSDSLLAFALRARARGVPIDGIGLQSHFELPGPGATQPVPTQAQLEANIRRFGDAGFDVRITELDVRLRDGTDGLADQAAAYQVVLRACLAVPRCKAVTTWGVSDKASWIPGFHTGFGRALLFDDQYAGKPAYGSLLSYLAAAAGSR